MDNYETEKVKVHYFRYLGRTAIGELSFVLSSVCLPQQLRLNLYPVSLLPLAPGLKRIAVTLRLRRPRSQTHQSKHDSVPTSAVNHHISVNRTRQLDAVDTYLSSTPVIRHLIDLFYTHASFMFPWESKTAILSDIEADAASACLIYCMCAIGAR
jgi:hypothetical protein